MKDLAQLLSDVAARAFAAAGLEPALGTVKPSDRPELADFQCNGALAAAKAAGRKPQDLAADIVKAWQAIDDGAELSIAGPGFINVRLTDAAIAARAQAIVGDARAGAAKLSEPRRVVIDYGGPNVAKGMHVGHLRASIIGESVKRLFRFRGDTVWGDAHFGDWGFQMGLMIVVLEEELGGSGRRPNSPPA